MTARWLCSFIAVPGAPVGLGVVPSQTNCTVVRLIWNPPQMNGNNANKKSLAAQTIKVVLLIECMVRPPLRWPLNRGSP